MSKMRMVLWHVVTVWIVGFFSVSAHAGGNIQFGQGVPAVADTSEVARGVAQTQAAQIKKQKSIESLPGVNRVILAPVTPEESEQAIQSRVLPKDLNQGVPSEPLVVPSTNTDMAPSATRVSGDTAPTGPASIAELARALKNDPDLIYEYVHNNIAYYPTWGLQKGAIGTLLDNQGTAFDQATLMVQLLRQAGFTANHVKGRIGLTAAQVQD